MTSKQRKWLFAAIKLAIVALLIWGIHRTLGNALDDLHQHPLRLNPAWLVAAAAIYLLAMLPSAIFWHRVLLAMGQPVRLFPAVRAYYIGHLGKYVPGKALVVVLRAGLVRGPGVSGAAAAISVFVETLTMMASGSFVAAALIAVNYRQHWLYVAAAIWCMFVSGLPTLPPIFQRIMRWTRIGRASPNAATQLQRLGYGTLLFGWLATGIGWVAMGLSLTAVLHSIGQTSTGWLSGLPLTTMAVCVSVVAGFMSFIPGGFVVREVVAAELIRPELGSEVAVASAIVLRLVWLVVELAAAGLLYLTHITRVKPRLNNLPGSQPPSNSPAP